MAVQYGNQNSNLSPLQWKILKYILMHNNCDYQSIADKLKRRRTTIFQSVKPLLREGYLEQHRVDPTQRNSKVVLSLSRKGKDYVWSKRYLVNIPIRFKDIFSTETDSIILEYLQVLEKVNDSSLQVDLMDQLEYYLFSAPISNTIQFNYNKMAQQYLQS